MFVLKEDGGNLVFKDSLKRYLLIMLVCSIIFDILSFPFFFSCSTADQSRIKSVTA